MILPDFSLLKTPGPACGECGATSTRLTDGSEVYPHRRDLHHKKIFVCPCGAYVGCHPGTQTPLGTPAGKLLRRARQLLHVQRVDPLWLGRPKEARTRVYAFMAAKLRLTQDECHIGLFDLERCRDAWRAFKGVTREDIDKFTT